MQSQLPDISKNILQNVLSKHKEGHSLWDPDVMSNKCQSYDQYQMRTA